MKRFEIEFIDGYREEIFETEKEASDMYEDCKNFIGVKEVK